jgi:hypothetical protein
VPLLDVAMWIALAFCVSLTIYGFTTWRSGGDGNANVGLMGALAPASHLLRDILSDELRFALLAVGLVVTISWRVLLSRKRRQAVVPPV